MSEVAELAARLVEIESINPDVVPGGSGEVEIARFVAGWCERQRCLASSSSVVSLSPLGRSYRPINEAGRTVAFAL